MRTSLAMTPIVMIRVIGFLENVAAGVTSSFRVQALLIVRLSQTCSTISGWLRLNIRAVAINKRKFFDASWMCGVWRDSFLAGRFAGDERSNSVERIFRRTYGCWRDV
jgi:hypothetical protein